MIRNISATTRALFLASVFAVVLDVARVGISQKINFIFLIWNLALAWIPYSVGSFIEKDSSPKRFFLLFIPWLLFFPNAAYLITDILHVDNRPPIPLWYDSLIFFLFAWLGTMLAALSLRQIHAYIDTVFGKVYGIITVFTISFLTAFGIYLGRFERWNSWDVFFNPIGLFTNVMELWKTALYNQELPLFVATFTLTILVTYYVIREVVEEK